METDSVKNLHMRVRDVYTFHLNEKYPRNYLSRCIQSLQAGRILPISLFIDISNVSEWLAPLACKINQILYCDWLPEHQNGAIFPAWNFWKSYLFVISIRTLKNLETTILSYMIVLKQEKFSSRQVQQSHLWCRPLHQ